MTKPRKKTVGKKLLKGRGGFTLAEMIVAMGMYSVLISIAVGGFANAVRTQRRTAAIMGANTTASIIAEQITREVRTGKTFRTVNGDLAFVNQKGQYVEYFKDTATNELMRSVGGNAQSLTPTDLKVETFMASLLAGSSPARVTFLLTLSPAAADVTLGAVTIQTTVSARNLDL